jgi:hypothetical protein
MRALTASLIVALAFLAGCSDDTPAPPPAAVAEPAPVAKPAGLDIDSIGVHVTGITELTLDEQGAMEIPHEAGTVGWYPLGPVPGETGAAILTGHISYNGPGVFEHLGDMKVGDEIGVTRADGTSVRFRTYAVDTYLKAEFPTDKVFAELDHPELKLISCGGALDKVNHTYDSNIVVSARLA